MMVGSWAVLPVPTAASSGMTLASVPIYGDGDWGGSLQASALTVVTRVRDVSLAGVRLLSDRQPNALRVENKGSGPPHIWLHPEGGPFAWIVVDIGPRAWSQLAYQFGHELGHVVCNLWRHDTHSPTACAWLEEALAEAFSIRGLGLLAESWTADPPFPGDAAYGRAIRQYRDDLLAKYQAVDREQGARADLAAWYRAHRTELEQNGDIRGPARGAVMAMLAALTSDRGAVEALGGLYRWPDQPGMPMAGYLARWERSCAEIGASRTLPAWLRTQLS